VTADVITSPRLRELLGMRRFLDIEIAAERRRIAGDPAAELIQAAADLYGTTAEDVRAGSSERPAVRARMIACWMLRETGKSFPEIGRVLGLHHTSVMHACKVIAADPARLALARRLLAEEVAA
jgi:chromosomal replication initiation ATPase DnaA